MGCIGQPNFPPPIPTLPKGVAFAPFTPPVIPGVGLCCKTPTLTFPTPAIPIPLPTAAINALSALFAGVLTDIQATIDAAVPTCPKL